MNRFEVAVIVLVFVAGMTLVHSQCNDPMPVFKRPEDCCSYSRLIPESVMDECRSASGGHAKGPRPPGGPIKGCCKTECSFNRTGLYANGALNEQQIRTTFVANAGAGFAATVNSALDRCLPLARNRAAEFTASVTSGSNTCSPITVFLFMCTNSNMVADCPAANLKASDADCVTLQNYFRECRNGPQ